MNSFVYLHPSKEMMTTEEPHTKRKSDEFCDSNIFLEEIPLFWKRRISSIKEVEKFTSHELRINYAKRKIKEMCCSPMLSYTPAQVAEKFLFLIDKDNKLTKGDLKAILNDVYNLKDRIRKNIDDINYILWFNPKYRESLRRFVESRLFYLYKVYKLMKSSLKLIRR